MTGQQSPIRLIGRSWPSLGAARGFIRRLGGQLDFPRDGISYLEQHIAEPHAMQARHLARAVVELGALRTEQADSARVAVRAKGGAGMRRVRTAAPLTFPNAPAQSPSAPGAALGKAKSIALVWLEAHLRV